MKVVKEKTNIVAIKAMDWMDHDSDEFYHAICAMFVIRKSDSLLDLLDTILSDVANLGQREGWGKRLPITGVSISMEGIAHSLEFLVTSSCTMIEL